MQPLTLDASSQIEGADLSAEAQIEGPTCRPKPKAKADVAQLAERVLGKDEVTSSILVIGSSEPDADRQDGQAARRSAISTFVTGLPARDCARASASRGLGPPKTTNEDRRHG